MALKVAISGKGGVGKTTVASTLVKLFGKSHQTVFAIDADPDACLAAGVGIDEETINSVKPLVELKELIDERMGTGAFYSINPKVDDILDDYSIKIGNTRFLKMGGIKQGGSACYCRENNFLSAVMGALLIDKDDAVVMDMGAGIEHLTRGTARGVDVMLVVIEPSKNSVNTAKTVKQLAKDLGIEKVRFIGNKIRNSKEKDFILSQIDSNELLGFIPFDDEIWESSMDRGPAAELGGELLRSMEKIHQKLLQEVAAEGKK